MLEEENVGEVNNDLNSELSKLIVSMSALNIDHKATIAVCYAQYFQQRVREFEEIEQQIRLLVKSFKSKTSKFEIAKIPGDIKKLRDKCVSNTGENYNNIQAEGFSGFSSEQYYRSRKNIIAQRTTNARKSANESDLLKLKKETEMKIGNGDDFCDLFLEEDDSGGSPALRVKPPNMVDAPQIEKSTAATSTATTSSESATIVHIDKTGAVRSSSPLSVTGTSSNMVEASKPVSKAITSAVAEQSWVVVDTSSNMVESPKLFLRATTSGAIKQGWAVASHSINMLEAARPAIKLTIKQSPILTGHPSHVVEASKPVIKASTSGIIKQSLVVTGHSSNTASESVIKATTSGITKQSPKIDKLNIVKSPDVAKSVTVAQSPAIDGSNDASRSQGGVIPIQIDLEDVENLCRNIPEENHKFPARLRLKRYLTEMTGPENLPDVVQHTNADETAPKRRRV